MEDDDRQRMPPIAGGPAERREDRNDQLNDEASSHPENEPAEPDPDAVSERFGINPRSLYKPGVQKPD